MAVHALLIAIYSTYMCAPSNYLATSDASLKLNGLNYNRFVKIIVVVFNSCAILFDLSSYVQCPMNHLINGSSLLETESVCSVGTK